MQMESFGAPGVYLVSSNFLKDAKSAAADYAMPSIRIVTMPSEEWYRDRRTAEEVRHLVEDAFDPIVEALTTPLTPEEAEPQQEPVVEHPPIQFSGANYAEVVEKFNESFVEGQMSDGLPLVLPTREAVDLMLQATTRAPDEVIGKVPMKFGNATIEKIAISSVMAGAKPEYFPVIIAAMEAFCAGEEFWHMMGSSGNFTLILMVNGPIAREIGMNSGIGFLGDGWRANSTIGRAVRLATRNIGHTWPAINDMALVGRPSSHTFYTFAENEEMSPWEPFHVSLGYGREDSAVTVTKVGSYSGWTGRTVGGGAVATWTEQSILDNMAELATGRRNNYWAWFHPEAAKRLKETGFDARKDIQDWFAKNTDGPAAENFSIAVTGGVPGYSMIWSFEPTCHVTKKISGATLTEAGR
jgi:hypothetical protein